MNGNTFRLFFRVAFCCLSYIANNGLICAEDVLPSYREAPQEGQPESTGPPSRRRLTRPYDDSSKNSFRDNRPQTDKETKNEVWENPEEVQKAKIIQENELTETDSSFKRRGSSFPNNSESRPPKKQKARYLHHLYFEPLMLGVGGFWSFGYLGRVGSGKALHLGMDIYNAGTNISLLVQGLNKNPRYRLIAILLHLGIHFFIDDIQLKGLDLGFDLRSGLIVIPTSQNAIVVQVALEVPVSYRFVLTFYPRTGRPKLSLGIAPYIALSAGVFFTNSATIAILSANDRAFAEYLGNGNLSVEPNVIRHIDPISLRIALRFGFDISFVF